MRDTPTRLRAPRRWGQNFLVNQGAADTLVIAFRPLPSDLVLEIGPGRAALTRRLAGRVSKLVAVEIDSALVAALREELRAAPSVEIVEADVLELDLRSLIEGLGATAERRARVIANLPYSIATTVILRLIEERALLSDLLVLVQREVAERIASPPGHKAYGGLSVLCQARAHVETLLRLSGLISRGIGSSRCWGASGCAGRKTRRPGPPSPPAHWRPCCARPLHNDARLF